jgi:hypothetical protein
MFFTELNSKLVSGGDGITPAKYIAMVTSREPEVFLCKGELSDTLSLHCSRIMEARDFLNHNITAYQRAGAAIPVDDALVIEEIRRLAKRLDGNATGKMSNSRKFAWVTTTACIDQVRERLATSTATASTLADETRNRLGLSHYLAGDILVEIQYPDDEIASLDIRAPGFLEGGDGPVFLSNPQSNGWGMTVDLATWEAGCREGVHRACAFTSKFCIREIGQVAVDVDVNYEAIMKALAGSRSLWSAHEFGKAVSEL